jgi:hypothetical protein
MERKASTGKVSGLGWPGAKEMMPGRSITALIFRMAEKRMPRALSEKRPSISMVGGVYQRGQARPPGDRPSAPEDEFRSRVPSRPAGSTARPLRGGLTGP